MILWGKAGYHYHVWIHDNNKLLWVFVSSLSNLIGPTNKKIATVSIQTIIQTGSLQTIVIKVIGNVWVNIKSLGTFVYKPSSITIRKCTEMEFLALTIGRHPCTCWTCNTAYVGQFCAENNNGFICCFRENGVASATATRRSYTPETTQPTYPVMSGVPKAAVPTKLTAPVHIDIGGTIYTSSLENLTK